MVSLTERRIHGSDVKKASVSTPVLRGVRRKRNCRIALFIANGSPGGELQRDDARPDRQLAVRSVILRGTFANFRGGFRKRQSQNARGFQLLFIGPPPIVPPSRKHFFRDPSPR